MRNLFGSHGGDMKWSHCPKINRIGLGYGSSEAVRMKCNSWIWGMDEWDQEFYGFLLKQSMAARRHVFHWMARSKGTY